MWTQGGMMKIKKRLIIVLILVAAVGFLCWLLKNRIFERQGPAPEIRQSASQIHNALQSTNTADIFSTTTNSQPKQSQSLQTNIASTTFEEQRQAAVQNVLERNKAISFWGQVLDQNGQPISDVLITIQVRHWHYNPPADLDSDFAKHDLTTDTDGKFEITGVNGDVLELEGMTKEGYRLSPKTPHSLGTSGGSLEKPVIFKMWKESANEPLISGNHVFGIDLGKSYTLDLIQGEKFAGETFGDLRVLITRLSEVKPREKYSWSFSIEAIDGGLLESDDEFMYLAPESGYEPKIERQFDPADSDWQREVSQQFFIRTRNGQVYGRVQATIYSDYNIHSAIELNYAINPNGSRNLQP
jgi:hypothetical protein